MTVTASNYELRPNDLYETEAWAVDALVRVFKDIRNAIVYEPAAGNHAIARSLKQYHADTVTSDIEKYDQKHHFEADFLTDSICIRVAESVDWIITNPPYGKSNRLAVKFIERALQVPNVSIAMLLTAKFDFGKTRRHLFADNERFAAKIALLDRISWAGNGQTGTEDHAWYVWRPHDPHTIGNRSQMFWEAKQ